MATKKNLEVVRIPYNATKPSHLSPESILLIEIGTGDIGKDEYEDIEKKLQHIPDLEFLKDSETFSWPQRHLIIGQSYKNENFSSWDADYMMYACVDEEAGLPQNKYLEDIIEKQKGKGRWTAMGEIKVYGDAFVFKMKSDSEGSDEPKRAQYVDMDEDFLWSVNLARDLLRQLLMYPRKGEWKYGNVTYYQ